MEQQQTDNEATGGPLRSTAGLGLGSRKEIEHAARFMDEYWPGWHCSAYRCEHYREKDSEGDAWCWLRHGIGAERREPECPAFRRAAERAMMMPNG